MTATWQRARLARCECGTVSGLEETTIPTLIDRRLWLQKGSSTPGVMWLWNLSRHEPLDDPAAVYTGVAQPVLEPVLPTLQELYPVEHNAVAAPVRRDISVSRVDRGGESTFKCSPVRNDLSLMAGTEHGLYLGWRRCEINRDFIPRERFDSTSEPHRSEESGPEEGCCRVWHGFKIVRLGTVQVGLKDEASLVDIVELNHPHRWRTCSIGSSNRHGGWHQLTCVSSLSEPLSELIMG